MGLKAWLIPQEKQFFDLLEKQMSIVREGTTVLRDMVDDKDEKGPAHYQQVLEEVEHRGDDTVHDIYHALNQTFITPIDREDIIALTSAMDDVLDHINDATRRMIIYGVDPRKDEVIKHLSRCQPARRWTAISAISTSLRTTPTTSIWTRWAGSSTARGLNRSP
jgi:uncharacterized protein Yka (UPF0111/DUF47 family)